MNVADRIHELEERIQQLASEIAGLPVRWEEIIGSPASGAISSDLFVCTLELDAPAGTETVPGMTTGTVRLVGKEGAQATYEVIGIFSIANPYPSPLPRDFAGEIAIYPCQQIAGGGSPAVFLIQGADVKRLLAAAPGGQNPSFGPTKSLGVPESGGASAEDMQWLGHVCEEEQP